MDAIIFIGVIVLGASLLITLEISSRKVNPNKGFGKWWNKYICEDLDNSKEF